QGAWFGLLVTALNLMPIGQLDGGHVAYALLGPRGSRLLTRLGILACLALLFTTPMWLVWSVLAIFLARFGHPPTLFEDLPVGRARVAVGLVALAVFVLCFTPTPIVITWHDFGLAMAGLAGVTSR